VKKSRPGRATWLATALPPPPCWRRRLYARAASSCRGTPDEIKRGIEKAVTWWSEQLKKLSKPTKDHKENRLRSGSSRPTADSTIGNIIAEAMGRWARRCDHVEEAKASNHARGGRRHAVRRGYLSPYFVSDPERMRRLEDPYISSTRRRFRR